MTFACIMIDPPWPERGGGKIKRGADRHYPLMRWQETLSVLLRAPVWTPAPSCHLWCWYTDNHLLAALKLVEALDFRYVRTMAWAKDRIGIGQYMRGQHEGCILAVRGAAMKPARAPSSLVVAKRRQHSRKPDEAIATIERVSPGPRLEMFARGPREGWTTWGNEA
ncbi:MAG: methyltransferase [Deltaproteobacteria bacterium]|nr:methyltransferase [Deltaproteobacteria bacterium]